MYTTGHIHFLNNELVQACNEANVAVVSYSNDINLFLNDFPLHELPLQASPSQILRIQMWRKSHMELVNKQKARPKKGFHDSADICIIYLPMHAFGTGLVFHYL